MAILESYTRRQKRLKGDSQDVFQYGKVPDRLRVQICHILTKACGAEHRDFLGSNPIYAEIEQSLAADFGLFTLGSQLRGNKVSLLSYFVEEADNDKALDIIDRAFLALALYGRDHQWRDSWGQELSTSEAIADLNERLLENSIGYAFIDGNPPQLIRKDNDQLHQSAIIPALRLLHEEGFSGANDEYRKAHGHYRHGSNKECFNECLKAFESTMKTICSKRKWEYQPTDTARALIDICLKNGLLPVFMQSHLGTVKSALESAIPTVRNKLGGHGQGAVPVDVPVFYAEYLLNETAATIVFLVEAYRSLK